MNLHRLKWLGHVLGMPSRNLPRHTMLAEVGAVWKKAQGSQTKTWHQCVKSLTVGLSHVGQCRLASWGLRDKRNQWLETLGDMAQDRCQWRRCIHTSSSS
ncbi:unnamed protein product [Heterobilharzia americana]|nr:unnamed protein product [Heterobilharzia americana]